MAEKQDKPIFKVSYHGGELFALVVAATPDEAVEIARAHRQAKFRGTPPTSVGEDNYEVSAPTERDIRWCHECQTGVQTGMPPRKRTKGGTLSDRGLRAIRLPEDVERAAPPESWVA